MSVVGLGKNECPGASHCALAKSECPDASYCALATRLKEQLGAPPDLSQEAVWCLQHILPPSKGCYVWLIGTPVVAPVGI